MIFFVPCVKVSSNACILMLHLSVPCVSLVSSSLPVCTWVCLHISELRKAIDLDDLLLISFWERPDILKVSGVQ